MPRFKDLLEYLAEPGLESVWVLLDIKLDDDAEYLITRIAETIAAAGTKSSSSGSDWTHRIVLGCWTAKHLRLCHELLPDFAIAWIGIGLDLAYEYLQVPNVAINIRYETLFCHGGPRFLRDCQEDGRPVYGWTVNSVSWMQWAIEKELDCVITDDPKLYLEVSAPYRVGDGEPRLAKKRWGVAAIVRDTSAWLILPVVIRFVTTVTKYYQRVGSAAQTRKVLQGLQNT